MPKRKVRLTPVEESAVSAAPSSNTENETFTASQPAQAAQPFEEVGEGTRGRPRGARVSIPLKDDRTPNLEECKAETLAFLRGILVDPKLREQLGIAGIPPEMIFSDQDIGMLLDLLGGIEGQIFCWLGKIDPDIAIGQAMWTPQEKGMITPPAKAVLAKNAASLAWFLRWRDEITLGLLMISITRAKYSNAKNLMQMRKDGKIPPMVVPGEQPVQPAPVNGQEFLVNEKAPN